LNMRTDKNRKPYFVCDPCGMQLFIRRKQGSERLQEIFENIEKAQIPFSEHARDLYEIQALVKEVHGVKAEIEKIGFFGLFSDHKYRIYNSLKTKLDNLLFELEQNTKRAAKES
jgi:hypothetical protein